MARETLIALVALLLGAGIAWGVMRAMKRRCPCSSAAALPVGASTTSAPDVDDDDGGSTSTANTADVGTLAAPLPIWRVPGIAI